MRTTGVFPDGVCARSPRGSRARAQARLGALAALPAYELALDLDPSAGRLQLDETLRFVHGGALPLRELVLMIYANTAGARRADGTEAVQLAGGRCIEREVEARAAAREPKQESQPCRIVRERRRRGDPRARAGAGCARRAGIRTSGSSRQARSARRVAGPVLGRNRRRNSSGACSDRGGGADLSGLLRELMRGGPGK